jgi:hypothetical protein
MKVPNIKFRGNPSSGSRADTCGRTDISTDVTKLIGAFATMRLLLRICSFSPKEHRFAWNFTRFSGCSSDRRSIKMEVSMEHWYFDTDNGKWGTRRETCSSDTFSDKNAIQTGREYYPNPRLSEIDLINVQSFSFYFTENTLYIYYIDE